MKVEIAAGILSLGLVLFAPPTRCAEGADPPSAPEDTDCSLLVPKPALAKAAYPDHRFYLREHNEGFETATLADKVTLQIHYYSCEDSVAEIFTFTAAAVPGKDHDAAYWSAFARKELAALKITEDGAYPVKTLDAFLAKLPQYKRAGDKIGVCEDQTAPDADGCSWNSGGGSFFSLEREKATMTISVSHDSSH
jgi:hypothetical protein